MSPFFEIAYSDIFDKLVFDFTETSYRHMVDFNSTPQYALDVIDGEINYQEIAHASD